MSCYEEGRWSALQGEPKSENPYMSRSDAAEFWNLGYEDAFKSEEQLNLEREQAMKIFLARNGVMIH